MSSRFVRVPSQPFLALLETLGPQVPMAQSDARRRAIDRARFEGEITITQADELAMNVLGLHPCEVWTDWFELGELESM